MDTDGKGKPDLTNESSSEKGPGGTGGNVESSKRKEGIHCRAAEMAEEEYS